MGKEGNVILEVKNLKKHFKVGGGATLKAVDDVSFFVREGETLDYLRKNCNWNV